MTQPEKDVSRLDEHAWSALQDAVRRLLAVHAPGWTDDVDYDPGVTLVELAAFLIRELGLRDAIPAGASTAVSRIEHTLSLLPWRSAPEVSVDGERWEFVDSFRDSPPEGPVFSIDDAGTVIFGDGVHGRSPQSGSRVTVRFRHGIGGESTMSLQVEWPCPMRVYAVTTGQRSGMRFEVADVVGESWSGAKRPRYFDGRLLTAADFREEQEYHIRKRREHQVALHGAGIVAGLGVAGADDGAAVTIGAGLAIDPEGRDIHVGEDMCVSVPPGAASPLYVVLVYAERATGMAPSPVAEEAAATHIEEGCRVLVSPKCEGGVAIARLVRTANGWEVDASHQPARVRTSSK